MDLATILGCLLGAAVIIGTMMYEGNLAIFFNIPAMAIVVGGMTCATMIHFSMGQFLGIFSVIKKTLLHKTEPPKKLIQQIVDYSVINRRDGALALEQEIPKIKNRLLAKGIEMVVNGTNEHAIRELMEMDIQYMQERHGMGKKILEFMGSSCPSFAMVGTLIGLVNMLSNMEDPSQIGRGMATALVCTFYGALVANLIFLPMAGKLGQHSKSESINMEMIMEGVCGIAKGDSPSGLREKMQVFISSKRREVSKAKA